MKKVGVAILGLGVVGGGTYKILTQNAEFYRKTQNIDIVVESVLECDPERTKALGIPAEKIATNIAEAVFNADVDIVVEAVGGITAAREYVLASLSAGKTVVTSNAELLCKFFRELEHTAKRNNAGLYYGACCVGGVPAVRTLFDGVQSNVISSVTGIVNGTANYMLTRMSASGCSYEEALGDAKALGYAGDDPVPDVEGFDAAYKLSILASIAFHTRVPFAKVFREGIGNISQEDIADGRQLGYSLKLLAIAKQTPAGIEARVHPAFVKEGHPLAAVDGCFDAVYLTGEPVGEIMLYGKGAGAFPTGSAIVSDIIYASKHAENRYSNFKYGASAEKDIKFVGDFSGAYYLRLTVSDRAGALAKIAALFAKYNISVEELIQKTDAAETATIALVTHETHEFAVKNAVARINASGIAKVVSVVRVAV